MLYMQYNFYAMRKFHKSIIFSKTILKGYYSYKDYFQIYPANLDKMPKSEFQRHFPIIIEYWTDKNDMIEVSSEFDMIKNFASDIATIETKLDRILALLSVISNHLFFRYNDSLGFWGMPMLKDNPGEEANEWSSKWNLQLFHWPEKSKQLSISNFTKLNLNEVKFKEHLNYYQSFPNLDFEAKKEITFPKTINKVLDSYFSKNPGIQAIIDTAISYSISAIEFRQNKKTLSILCSFTSMETMVNLEFRDDKPEICSECGQLKYKVSKKYRDFLLKYIGKGQANKKKFNSYYSLRSNIVHTGARLKTENLFVDIPKEEKKKEFLKHIEILQLGKLAIVNWLYKN